MLRRPRPRSVRPLYVELRPFVVGRECRFPCPRNCITGGVNRSSRPRRTRGWKRRQGYAENRTSRCRRRSRRPGTPASRWPLGHRFGAIERARARLHLLDPAAVRLDWIGVAVAVDRRVRVDGLDDRPATRRTGFLGFRKWAIAGRRPDTTRRRTGASWRCSTLRRRKARELDRAADRQDAWRRSRAICLAFPSRAEDRPVGAHAARLQSTTLSSFTPTMHGISFNRQEL